MILMRFAPRARGERKPRASGDDPELGEPGRVLIV